MINTTFANLPARLATLGAMAAIWAALSLPGCKKKTTTDGEPPSKSTPKKSEPVVKKKTEPVKKTVVKQKTKQPVKVVKQKPKPKPKKKPKDPVKAALARIAELEGTTRKNISGEISEIDLKYTDVTDDDLAMVNLFPYLRLINLSGCKKITDNGLKHLKELPRLQELYLFETNIGDKGLSHLTESTYLEKVCLDGTKITDAGLKYMKKWEAIHMLHINSRNKLSDDGLDQLKHLTSLRELKVGKGITKDGIRRLKKEVPDCKVEMPGTVRID